LQDLSARKAVRLNSRSASYNLRAASFTASIVPESGGLFEVARERQANSVRCR